MRELTEYEKYQQLYSDMFKDAYGFRPRGMTPDTVEGIRAELDALQEQIGCDNEQARQRAEEDVARFEARIQEVIGLGAGDRETALRWITDTADQKILLPRDVETYVYDQGLLFTDYGRALVKELETILFTEEELANE